MKLIELLEFKTELTSNYAPLYHGTTLENAFKIMKVGEIQPSKTYNNLSLTRDPDLWYGADKIGNGLVQFVINQNALRQNYKIKPHSYFHRCQSGRDRKQEYEETIPNSIPIIPKYVPKIVIIKEIIDSINDPNTPQKTRNMIKMK